MKAFLILYLALVSVVSVKAQQVAKEKVKKVATCNIKTMDRKISIFKNTKGEFGVLDNLYGSKEIEGIKKPQVIPASQLNEDLNGVIEYAGVDPKNVKQVVIYDLADPGDGDPRMVFQIIEKNKKQTSLLVTMGITICDKK